MSKGWKYWDNDFREWKEVEPDYLDTIFDGQITTNRFETGIRAPQEVVVLAVMDLRVPRSRTN